MVKLRQFSEEGTITNVELPLEKAKALVREALSKGCVVVDAKKQLVINDISPEVEEIQIVRPVGGG